VFLNDNLAQELWSAVEWVPCSAFLLAEGSHFLSPAWPSEPGEEEGRMSQGRSAVFVPWIGELAPIESMALKKCH